MEIHCRVIPPPQHLNVKLVGVDFFPQCLPADAEDLGGLRAVSLGELDDPGDMRLFRLSSYFLQRRQGSLGLSGTGDMGGQVLTIDNPATGQGDSTIHHIEQFADVAGKGILHQCINRLGAE